MWFRQCLNQAQPQNIQKAIASDHDHPKRHHRNNPSWLPLYNNPSWLSFRQLRRWSPRVILSKEPGQGYTWLQRIISGSWSWWRNIFLWILILIAKYFLSRRWCGAIRLPSRVPSQSSCCNHPEREAVVPCAVLWLPSSCSAQDSWFNTRRGTVHLYAVPWMYNCNIGQYSGRPFWCRT